MPDPNSRLVFSTAVSDACAPAAFLQNRRALQIGQRRPAVLPHRVTAKLRIEKAGRGGKMVTVVVGRPNNPALLKDLSQEPKRVCGTGDVQLQGDLRDRVRSVLIDKGFKVKG